MSLALSHDVTPTTPVRDAPQGSGVTATGTVTMSPGPDSGDRQCLLPPPELPVTCTSVFQNGTKVTLRANPGP